MTYKMSLTHEKTFPNLYDKKIRNFDKLIENSLWYKNMNRFYDENLQQNTGKWRS